jgi:long-subunit acyl-CoA synthetase (AMP-forming)
LKRTIPTLFRRAVDDASDSTWLLAGENAYSYAQALDQIERASSALRTTGVDRGDRVPRHGAQHARIPAHLGSPMEVGAVQVPVTRRARRARRFRAAGCPRLVVTDDDLAPLVGDASRSTSVRLRRAPTVVVLRMSTNATSRS